MNLNDHFAKSIHELAELRDAFDLVATNHEALTGNINEFFTDYLVSALMERGYTVHEATQIVDRRDNPKVAQQIAMALR